MGWRRRRTKSTPVVPRVNPWYESMADTLKNSIGTLRSSEIPFSLLYWAIFTHACWLLCFCIQKSSYNTKWMTPESLSIVRKMLSSWNEQRRHLHGQKWRRSSWWKARAFLAIETETEFLRIVCHAIKNFWYIVYRDLQENNRHLSVHHTLKMAGTENLLCTPKGIAGIPGRLFSNTSRRTKPCQGYQQFLLGCMIFASERGKKAYQICVDFTQRKFSTL